jgi:signal peptidase II
VPRSRRALAVAIAAAALVTALDLGSKTWVESHLSRARLGAAPELCVADEDGVVRFQRIRHLPMVLIEDVFELEYAENCGAAFGLLRTAPAAARRVVFGLAAVVACGALFFLFVRGRGGPYFAAAVPLVAAGALGNLADRVRYGYVVDFLHVHWGVAFDYPTFNVADVTITVGVLCWIIDAVQGGRAPVAAPHASPPEPEHDREAQQAP